jgi:hypothetical protein
MGSDRNDSKASHELLDLLNLPAGLQGSQDPVEDNPFATDDARHRIWEKATLAAEQKVHLVNGAYATVAQEIPELQTLEEARRVVYAQVSWLWLAKLDIWAERYINILWGRPEIAAFDRWLAVYANASLNCAATLYPSHVHPWLIPELRTAFIARMEYWKSEARRYVSEQETTANTRTVVEAAAKPILPEIRLFEAAEDYRSVRYKGVPRTLTRNQSSMMRVLHKAHMAGHPDVDKDKLIEAIDAPTSNVRDSWKSSPLWKTLVVPGKRKGTYRLKIPKPTKRKT